MSESPTSPFNTNNGDEWGRMGTQWGRTSPHSKTLYSKGLSANGDYGDSKNHFSEKSNSLTLGCTTKPSEFAEQIKKAISNFDRLLAIQVSRALKGKIEVRKEVRAALTVEEFDNFRLLVTAGFVKGTHVRYVGTKCADQYAGLELVVDGISNYSEIACVMPDGSFTTWLDPKDLEAAD